MEMIDYKLPIVLDAPEVASLVIALSLYHSCITENPIDSRVKAHLENEELTDEGLNGIEHLMTTFSDYLREYKRKQK